MVNILKVTNPTTKGEKGNTKIMTSEATKK